jgi:NAD(P)-dependent dehydrogenase (short-subunit alcohol dehydrogenase family)
MATHAPKENPMCIAVTGASSGIGRAIAREAAVRGARVVVGARRIEQLQETAAGFPNIIPLPVDVSDEVASREWVRKAATLLGRLDVVVANAGYGELCSVSDYQADQLRRMFEVNVMGSWWTCVEAAAAIRRQSVGPSGLRGQVMMISSAAARRGLPMFGPYSATKAAQLSLCESLRIELRDEKIAVTSVHPVGTRTEFFEVAERTGKGRMPPRMAGDVQQSAEHVARRVCDAMGRRVREVWPFRPARFMLGLACVWPALADRIMYKARGMMTTTANMP